MPAGQDRFIGVRDALPGPSAAVRRKQGNVRLYGVEILCDLAKRGHTLSPSQRLGMFKLPLETGTSYYPLNSPG